MPDCFNAMVAYSIKCINWRKIDTIGPTWLSFFIRRYLSYPTSLEIKMIETFKASFFFDIQ